MQKQRPEQNLQVILKEDDLNQMEKLARVQLATSLPGPKPICLVGTRSSKAISNLAPFSSITHLGSNPILIGMVTRPNVVPRHTYQNIIDTEWWTLNHITEDFVKQAHQCSARYSQEESEFEETGLTEIYHPDILAPFVAQSPIRYALSLEEIIDIHSNKTKLIVGKVKLIEIPESTLAPDGRLDISSTLASTALDTYFTITEYTRLPYAKK